MTAVGALLLRERAAEYLALRRALGYKLAENERLLTQFLDYLERARITAITTQAAVAWAIEPTGAKPIYWRRRLSVVRGFAAPWLRAMKAPRFPLPVRCAAFPTGHRRTSTPTPRSSR